MSTREIPSPAIKKTENMVYMTPMTTTINMVATDMFLYESLAYTISMLYG
jgi:hypothetical protein